MPRISASTTTSGDEDCALRVAYIATGAAGMLCGTCLRDNTLAAALIERGHEVVLVPTYTPTRTDEANVSEKRIFFGALNVYLQEKIPFFRRTPRFLDALLDRPWLLAGLSRLAISADAKDLGALTLSVLQGEDGPQRKELDKLLDWLRDFRPEIVHLNNAMFLGFARTMKRELGVPVVCALTGEDLFLGDLPEPYRTQVVEELRRRAPDVDAFTVPGEYYRAFMSEYLDVPAGRISRVRLGIKTADFADLERRRSDAEPFVVGYLARICPEKGLHLLVEAFRELARSHGPEAVRLRVAGYLAKKDERYLAELKDRIQDWGLADRVDFVGEVDREGKRRFLEGIDAFSVPSVYLEPKGLSVLEAQAAGIPVVEPRHGIFPEILAATGGGLLVEPRSPAALAEALRSLAEDPDRRSELGRRGRRAVVERFHEGAMADEMIGVYEEQIRARGREAERLAG